jgi:hypothetical protein
VEVDVAGQPAGLGELRYSPQCGVAWARFEQFPHAQVPHGAMLHVDVLRPEDRSLRVPYQAPYNDNVPIYGNVMLSTARCVYAAVCDEPGKKPAKSRTHAWQNAGNPWRAPAESWS